MFKILGTSLFAAAMLVNVNLNKPDAQTTLLKENVEAIAMADGEVYWGFFCAEVVNVTCDFEYYRPGIRQYF